MEQYFPKFFRPNVKLIVSKHNELNPHEVGWIVSLEGRMDLESQQCLLLCDIWQKSLNLNDLMCKM